MLLKFFCLLRLLRVRSLLGTNTESEFIASGGTMVKDGTSSTCLRARAGDGDVRVRGECVMRLRR